MKELDDLNYIKSHNQMNELNRNIKITLMLQVSGDLYLCITATLCGNRIHRIG